MSNFCSLEDAFPDPANSSSRVKNHRKKHSSKKRYNPDRFSAKYPAETVEYNIDDPNVSYQPYSPPGPTDYKIEDNQDSFSLPPRHPMTYDGPAYQQVSERNDAPVEEARNELVIEEKESFNSEVVELAQKIDLILEKLQALESSEPTQENIHDIILFVVFGLFIIFAMDSVYRVGRNTF